MKDNKKLKVGVEDFLHLATSKVKNFFKQRK